MGESSEALWAEHGLTGLVLSALFGLIVLFLRTTSKKDASHQEFINKLIQDEREERKFTRKETTNTHSKLAEAIDSLTEELRSTNNAPKPYEIGKKVHD